MYLDKCDKDLIHFRAPDVWGEGHHPNEDDSGHYSIYVIAEAENFRLLGQFTGQLWREVERMRRGEWS